ncbi:hypothetical protein [Zobellella endophytica]|uniref:hypothetical protein n=1 Tax=Zobellella endophytica TaxID=2116700 RepID=UPI0011B23E86|nr:hypothetical protein [Zobellella endophytica]
MNTTNTSSTNNSITPLLIEHIKAISKELVQARKIKPELIEIKKTIEDSNLFNESWYLHRNIDIVLNPASCSDPLLHYIEFGGFEARNPNPYFDSSWYLENNKDVRESKLNPLVHFVLFGAKELRNPGPEFDTRWYVENHPDLADSKLNPLAHYLLFGKQEGRKCKP